MKVIVAECCAVVCFCSLAVADDFKTTNGKEYKNAKINRVEPDGVVIRFSGGIVKIPFTELSEELQRKYSYDPESAKQFAADVAQKQQLYLATHPVSTPTSALAEPTAKTSALAAPTANPKDPQAGQAVHTDSGFSIFPARDNGIEVTYKDRATLEAEESKHGEVEMLAKDHVAARIANIPKGGRIRVKIQRSQIESANTKWFTVIILNASGEELTRKAGEDSIAQLPTGAHGNWWNSVHVDLDQEINPYIDVFVADTIREKRSQFRITREH
jgi:hypothetical protein